MRGLFIIATCDVKESAEPLRFACAAKAPEYRFTVRDEQVCIEAGAKPVTSAALGAMRKFTCGFLSGYPVGYAHGVDAARKG